MERKIGGAGSLQQKRTEGVDDLMARPGIGYRIGQAIVDWAERLNLAYSAVGNPPVHDNATFPWAAEIEREWKLIREELDRVLTRKDELPGFHEIVREVSSISTDRDWKSFVFCGYGSVSEDAVRACPETWRILQKIPNMKAAMFSIFEPGKHLKPHRGPYNGVLRLHLGLKVPAEREKVAIRVVDQVCHWEEGKVLIFDDAYEHEAWNHSGETRVVL